jgi:hypothetical protein
MRASAKSLSRAAFGALGLALLAVLLGTAAQCGYNPNPPNGQLGCSAKSECPEGYSCRTDNKCWKAGATGAAGSTGTAGSTGASGAGGKAGSGGGTGGAGGAMMNACGHVVGTDGSNTDKLVGCWIFDDTSTLTQACGTMSMKASLKDDYVEVAANAKPNTVQGVYFCAWVLDVPAGGSVGTLEPNQTCMTTDTMTGTVFTWHGTTFTFTTTDGLNATLSSMIDATYIAKDKTTGTCTVGITGKLKLMK